MRRATLVPGLRVSWAVEGPRAEGDHGGHRGGGAEVSAWPGDAGPPGWLRLADPGPGGPQSASGCAPSPRKPPPGGDNGHSEVVCRSPQIGQRDCNPMWPGLRQVLCKVPIHQYSNLTVQVVLRGATGESPTEGSGLSRGGNTGGTRCSEEVRRPCEAVGRRFPGGPTTRTGAPFAPLSWRQPPDRLRLSRVGPRAIPARRREPCDRTRTALDRKHRPCWPFGSCHGGCKAVRAPLLSIRGPDSRLEQVVYNRPRVSLIPQIGHLPSTVSP